MKTGCDFCGELVPTRPLYAAYVPVKQEYVCRECFGDHDEMWGMTWDDLPEDDG